MAREDCVVKGCRVVVCCVVNDVERPIGLLTSSTLNSSESDGTTGTYLGGQEIPEQYDADFDPATLTPGEFFITSGVYYSLCGSSQTSCTHELTLNGDYCFIKTAQGQAFTADAADKLMCSQSSTFRIKLHDEETNDLDTIWEGKGRVTTKNRNFPGGQTDNLNWSATIEVDASTIRFFPGFH